ncbi:MAG: sulfotransferase [Gemmatimonadota bacterium]
MTDTRRADRAPVFVVGSARSGTTLLYHTLLSSGGYAVYRGEPALFDLVQPRYGDLRHRSSRTRLLGEWPRSHLARACGLDDVARCAEVLDSVRSNGDFLRAVMSRLAARQGVARWAVWGPDNLLLMPWIKRELPDARFVHMVRDGRDVALSIGTEGWIRPLPWDRGAESLVAALHWQWKVQRGRRDAARLGSDYLELHFEQLVQDRRGALEILSTFLGHAIDADAVADARIGTLRDPNSTFAGEHSPPVGRWRERMPPPLVASIEGAIGSTLEAFGYARGTAERGRPLSLAFAIYPSWFSLKHVLRTHSALGRLADRGRLRLDAPMAAEPLRQELEEARRA